MSEFYDIVDSAGNVVETAAEQASQIEANSAVVTLPEVPEIPLEREQPKLTEGEIKKLRKQYVTVQLPRVLACQHRLDLSRQPRHRNCETCWFAWFNSHGEIVQQCDEMFQADRGVMLTNLQGTKFVKRFLQSMSTIASWKATEAVKENSEQVS